MRNIKVHSEAADGPLHLYTIGEEDTTKLLINIKRFPYLKIDFTTKKDLVSSYRKNFVALDDDKSLLKYHLLKMGMANGSVDKFIFDAQLPVEYNTDKDYLRSHYIALIRSTKFFAVTSGRGNYSLYGYIDVDSMVIRRVHSETLPFEITTLAGRRIKPLCKEITTYYSPTHNPFSVVSEFESTHSLRQFLIENMIEEPLYFTPYPVDVQSNREYHPKGEHFSEYMKVGSVDVSNMLNNDDYKKHYIKDSNEVREIENTYTQIKNYVDTITF